MSAMNFIKFKDKIAVIADTAVYDWHGVIRTFGSKIEPCTRIPAIIATCGNIAVGNAVRAALRESESFDDLVDGMREFIAGETDGRMTYAVAGFRNGAPEVWLGSTLDGLPFQKRADVHLGQPPVSGDDLLRGFGKPIRDPAQITDLDDFARTLITLNRECVWGAKQGFAEGMHLVGGACELGVVTASGAEVRTVLTWLEDRVGELITPPPIDWNEWRRTHAEQADSAPVENAPRLSRHERRAAKAKARRAA